MQNILEENAKLDFPLSQEIPNTQEAVNQKFEEAKEAVRIFRIKYPESKKKFLFLPINNEQDDSLIHFAYVGLINCDSLFEGFIKTSKSTCITYDPIII